MQHNFWLHNPSFNLTINTFTFLYPRVNHIYNDVTEKKETVDILLCGKNGDDDFGAISMDTIDFIRKKDVPVGRDITYAAFVCNCRPLKSEPYHVRIVVGGDKLSYPDDPASPAISLLDTKLIINSTISDEKHGARFMSADLKDHFSASPMARPKYMKMPFKYFPPDIVQRYNLHNLKSKYGYIYIKIKKEMHGLKQAALLAYTKLVEHLAPHGYCPVPHSLGLWTHDTCPTRFCLCVDDFGIKYFSEGDEMHLIDILK